MIKKIMLFCVLFLLITNFLNMHLLFADRIGDMRDKIEEEKEKQEEEKPKPKPDDDDDDDDDDDGSFCAGLSGCIGLAALFSSDDDDSDGDSSGCAPGSGEASGCMIDLFNDLRYANYPYDPSNPYNFAGWADQSPDNEKMGYLQADVEGLYLFEDTYGVNAKASVNLSFIRVHCFYQFVFEPEDYFNVFSGNLGFTIPVADGMLHVFAGFYLMDIISEVTFSFGGEFTYFFPANMIFDVYSLNTFFGELGFHTFSCSVSYAVGNFSFGGGFNYNHYAGITFMGPMLKITLWI
ncbi:MAG: hypothetical protein JW822_14670 [Spirochaetales bacterium]|nr:hypothetical protein [Spirochaetales bacterium]